LRGDIFACQRCCFTKAPQLRCKLTRPYGRGSPFSHFGASLITVAPQATPTTSVPILWVQPPFFP